ncbi:MAG: threonine--tRNA ligase, partial [Thermoprotei archaeon]
MKALQLHVDYVEYEPIQPEAKIYEETERKKYRVDDALLLLTCVEEDDDPSIAQRVVEDVVEFMEKLRIDRLVIYPYAHLSVKLASPSKAIEILKKIG